ncbi:MAG: hypothetical protein H6705_16740 [Myxococcales bacterium]|nr:hypothetical protein [Myxococcales bacterium]
MAEHGLSGDGTVCHRWAEGMTTLLTARRRNRRWAYALRIAGHHYVYHSGPTPPADALPATWGDAPTGWLPYRAITQIGTFRETLPQLGGVAEQSPITLTLVGAGDGPARAGDPLDVFARLGVAAASWWAQMTAVDDGDAVTSTLFAELAPPFDIHLDRAPPAGGWPAVVHIGQEAMLVTAADGSEVGGADPYRITVGARALADTVARRHEARVATRDQPILTLGDPVFWRSRRAVLVAYEQLPNRTAGPSVELMRGFIESSPSPSDDGLSIQVQLVPLSALLSQETQLLAQRTRLARGIHYFEPGVGVDLWWGERAARPWQAPLAAVALAGAGELEFDPDDVAAWSARFDPALGPGHPRAGAIGYEHGQDFAVTAVSGAAGGPPADRLTLADGDAPVQEVDEGRIFHAADPITTWRRGRILDHGEAPRLLRWPGATFDDEDSAIGRLNAALEADDIAEGWTWPRIEPGGLILRSRTAATAYISLDRAAAAFSLTRLAQSTRADGDREHFEQPFDSLAMLSYPINLDAEDGGRRVDSNPGPRPPIDLRRIGEGVEPGIIGPRVRGDVWSYSTTGGPVARYGIGGYARAFREQGERYMLVTDAIDLSSGRVTVTAGGQRLALEVSPIIQELVPDIGAELDGESVYLIELLDPLAPAFGEWSDDDEVVIQAERPTFATSGELLAYLLTSSDHLALGADDVDLASILGDGADASWVRRWGVPEGDEPLSYGALIGGVLRASRSTLVMRTADDGRCRVTRVPLGVEDPARIVTEIAAGDWAASPVPKWGTDDKLINSLTVQAAYGNTAPPGEDEEFDWRYQRSFESRTSQRTFEEQAGEAIELYAGLEVDAASPEIEATARAAIATYEMPRRTWTGTVGAWLGAVAHLGSTVRVTSRHLRDAAGQRVEGRLGVVVDRLIDLWGESGCALTLAHTGRDAMGWAPAARVATIVNDTTVTVDAHAYTADDGIDPEDLDAFQVGDIVQCVPRCNMGAMISRTAVAIDRAARKVTFDAPHGLTRAKDYLIPNIWGGAGATFRMYAYMADANGKLGPANDPGHKYV